MAPITAMFDAMAKRDAAAMKKPLLPGGGMVLMRDGKPTQMTFDAFADLVGKPGKAQIEERIHDPLVRIDNDLAVVWAPFEFLVDGKVDHCGTDLFNLVRADGKWLIASVADTGPGILPELLDGLFAPFYTTKENGLGLGLSISSSIVRAHGGRIWAENAPGGGSVFHLTLPCVKETA